jgi:glucose/arabinose dehydrogenase
MACTDSRARLLPARPTPVPAGRDGASAAFDPAGTALRLERVVSGLRAPTAIAAAPDGSGRLYVTEKAGTIRIVRGTTLVAEPFLDIRALVGSSGSEQGLLGLAFHPRYTDTRTFFVNYTDRNGDTVVARYRVSADPERADPVSATVILTVRQPAANHNGGHLAFGPDGKLYIGLGDGGGAGDRFGNAQNPAALLGKMLRIDVDGGEPYAIPPDNPFRDHPNYRPEIWAVGLRNPWRYSFDRATGDLYIADVGQNAYEEINFQPASSRGGENYGWPRMEGTHCYPSGAACDRSGLVLPIGEYGRSGGCSVTGGYVYRGRAEPALTGAYFFADFCSGTFWSLHRDAAGRWVQTELLRSGVSISSFGEDEAGELYVVGYNNGTLYRLRAAAR